MNPGKNPQYPASNRSESREVPHFTFSQAPEPSDPEPLPWGHSQFHTVIHPTTRERPKPLEPMVLGQASLQKSHGTAIEMTTVSYRGKRKAVRSFSKAQLVPF